MIDKLNYGQCIAFEQISVGTTAGGFAFTPAKYAGVDISGGATQSYKANANIAKVTVEGTAGTNDIRYTEDGTVPTSTVGHLAEAGATSVRNTFTIRGRSNLVKFRAICNASNTTSVISVSFYIN